MPQTRTPDAQELKTPQSRDVFLDLFDYIEQFGAKEYEREYVRKFDFSQNTNLYLTMHNRKDFGKQSNEMHDFKQLFLDNVGTLYRYWTCERGWTSLTIQQLTKKFLQDILQKLKPT